MKFLVIGCGSIGKRHLKNLKEELQQEVIAFDPQIQVLREIEKKYKVEVFSSLKGAFDQKPDAVLITSPSAFHLSQATEAAKRGMHVFIEKPFCISLKGIDQFIGLVHRKKCVVLGACNMRFHWGISLVKSLLEKNILGKIYSIRMIVGFYLPYWHIGQDYRKNYSARQDLGGGVILDGIHEIDFARWLLGEVNKVFCFKGHLSDLEINVEDTAEILLHFNLGAIGEIHLNYLNRTRRRGFEIVGEKGIIYWDQERHEVGVFRDNSWQIHPEPFNYDINDMYVKEMKHFIDCINNKKNSINDEKEAKRVMEVVVGAKKSSQKGKWVKI